MATYIISDIHGEYDLFVKLLSSVNFSDKDTLFICGDIIDKGNDSIRLVKHIMKRPNIKAIQGNHEYYFLNFYESVMREVGDNEDYNKVLEKLQSFFPEDKEELTWEVVDYIESLPYFIERDKFICVHAGVKIGEENRILPLTYKDYKYYLFDRRFKEGNVNPKNSKTVFFGHTPTSYKNNSGEIIKTLIPNLRKGNSLQDYSKVWLDTGVYLTKMLGMIRIEDMQEFYCSK